MMHGEKRSAVIEDKKKKIEIVLIEQLQTFEYQIQIWGISRLLFRSFIHLTNMHRILCAHCKVFRAIVWFTSQHIEAQHRGDEQRQNKLNKFLIAHSW